MDERTTLRIGGWGAIIGGLLAVLVNVIRPRPSEGPGDLSAAVETAEANADLWRSAEIGAMVALLLLSVGFYAITKSIEDSPGRTWGRLGLGAVLVGTTLGVAAATISKGVGQAGNQISGEAVEAVLWVGAALLGAFVITYTGVAALLYGIALIQAIRFPTWLGWLTVLAGLSGLAAGLINAFAGSTTLSTLVLLPISILLLAFALVYVGVLLLRMPSV
jgi:hypothetical protein